MRQEIPIVAKEATFLISLAAEEFIRRLCEAGQQIADREKRSTVQHRDIGQVYCIYSCNGNTHPH